MIPFLEARFDQCRTPRWGDTTPIADRMVCGAVTLPGRTYCADCRKVLIAGYVDKNGEARWFRASVGARSAEKLSDSPDLGNDEDIAVQEAEPEGDRPLRPSDLYDWGMAA